jgi:nickel-dependent lactate racemase
MNISNLKIHLRKNYERESMIMIILKSGISSVKISELLGDKVGIMIIFSPGILKVKIPE